MLRGLFLLSIFCIKNQPSDFTTKNIPVNIMKIFLFVFIMNVHFMYVKFEADKRSFRGNFP